jgi:iron(III) transport system ATP-binding protein
MLTVTNLEKRFSANQGEEIVRALDGVSFHVPEGKMFTLLGASGSGKTTTLRSIAGLERPDAGRIEIGDVVVFDGAASRFLPPNKRDLGMVFQSYAIWPHMTVFDNVAFPLRIKRRPRKEIHETVERTLAIMGMEGLSSRPAPLLSGGQQQRLALARAIVTSPRLLLLDEPLSNLDAKLREQMRVELKRLQSSMGITTIYVTHDQTEALALSDEIAVMHLGEIVQLGSPDDIYYRPATEYVADFIGAMNFLPATLSQGVEVGGSCVVKVGAAPCPGVLAVATEAGANVVLAVRPEGITIREGHLTAAEEAGDRTMFNGKILHRIFLGESTEFLVDAAGVEMRARISGLRTDLPVDASVVVTLPGDGLVYPRAASSAEIVVDVGRDSLTGAQK